MSANLKQNPTREAEDAARKAAVLGEPDKKGSFPRKGMFIVLVLVLAAGAALLWTGLAPAPQPAGKAVSAAAGSDFVSYSVSEFADGKARHYSYAAPDGITVRYFILLSSDGVIRAAFDACDVCWRANRGYSQQGDMMICNNCGRRFPSVKINEEKGGCNPAPLARTVENDRVIIKIADIETGKQYFNFSS